IPHRRSEERRDPDAINAEACYVIQLLGDSREVADAIAVAVTETARIDLVDDGTLPPSVRHDPPPARSSAPALRIKLRLMQAPGKRVRSPLLTVLGAGAARGALLSQLSDRPPDARQEILFTAHHPLLLRHRKAAGIPLPLREDRQPLFAREIGVIE